MRIVLLALWAVLTAFPAHAAEEDGVLYGRALAFAQPGSPWDGHWQHFKGNLDKDPAIEIDYFIRGERGGETQQMHDIRRGRAHIGGISLQGMAVTVPELTVAMGPYLFDSVEEVDFVYDNFLYEFTDELMAERGLKLLTWTEVGWTNVYANKPVILPDDIRGLKLRGPRNYASQFFLNELGADSIPLSTADLVPGLQTGLVQGGVTSTVFHFFVTRRYATHYTLTRHSYDTGGVVINREWFDNATPEQRASIEAAWMPAADARVSVRRLVTGALQTMEGEGIEIHDPTPAELKTWKEASSGVTQRIIGKVGGRSQEMYDRIMEGKRAFAMRQQANAGEM